MNRIAFPMNRIAFPMNRSAFPMNRIAFPMNRIAFPMNRITLSRLLIFALLCLLALPVMAQPTERQRAVEEGLLPAVVIEGRDTVRYVIHDRMRRFDVGGLSIAVINDGVLEWAEGYGVKRAGGLDSVRTTTLFQAASISKPVAAAGALRLVEDGRLTLDEDVNAHLRSWAIPGNGFTADERVTLRRLLSHTAGTTVHGFPGYSHDEVIPSTVNVLNGLGNTAKVQVDTIPGSIWRYSGGGYTIAQLLITDVRGVPFADYMRDSVLRPLGMNESTFEHPLPDGLAHHAAMAHGWDGAPLPGGWHAYPEQAAAGLWTTPTDLARFALAVAEAFNGQSDEFLSPEITREMLTPVVSDDYGLGFGVIGSDDTFRFSHGGANAGFRCFLAMYPRTGDGVVVMTNSDAGADVATEVMRAVSDVYDWPDYKPELRAVATIDPALLDDYAGEYEVGPGFRLTMRAGEDRLLVDGTRRHPRVMYPESESVFFGEEINMRVRFDRDADGNVVGLAILRGENETPAKKLR